MPYGKDHYYEDNFVMNHFERISDDFVFLSESPRSIAATATITTVAEASLVDTKDFALTDAAGVTTTYNLSMGLSTSVNTDAYTPGTTVNIGMVGTTTRAEVRDQIITRINAGTSIGFTASESGDNVLVTQNTKGPIGNKTNTDEGTGLTVGNFTGGSKQPCNSATATITTVAEASLNDTKDFTLTDTAGVTTTYNLSMGLSTSTNSAVYTPGGTVTIGMVGATTAADVRDQIITRINAGTSIGFTASASGDNVLITQNTAGSAGNRTNTDEGTGLTVSNFSGGTNPAVPLSYATKGVRLRLNYDAYKTNLG